MQRSQVRGEWCGKNGWGWSMGWMSLGLGKGVGLGTSQTSLKVGLKTI